ncbi:MAG: hypothetical protein AMXMBFR64_22200 [Myxococcales bacterium]
MACTCDSRGGFHLSARDTPGELLPWSRLGGSTAATTITQPAEQWLDAGMFRHALLCLDVRAYSGDVHLFIQTAQVDEEDAFVTIVDHQPAATGRTWFKVEATATTPLLRFVRWKVGAGSGPWSLFARVAATFKSAA